MLALGAMTGIHEERHGVDHEAHTASQAQPPVKGNAGGFNLLIVAPLAVPAFVYGTRRAAPALVRIASSPSIICAISSRVTLSAGMKRSVSGRGELSSRPASNACATIAGPIGSFRSSASNSPRPRTSPRPCRADSRCNSLSRYSPASAAAFRNAGLPISSSTANPAAHIKRIAVERAALVAVLEAGGLLGRQQRRQRHAAADTLAERHDVGLDLRVLVVEQLSGPAHAGLDFVEDQQQAVFLRQRPQFAQELIGRGPNAGFTLDRLQHHGDGLVGDQFA